MRVDINYRSRMIKQKGLLMLLVATITTNDERCLLFYCTCGTTAP